MKGNVRMLAEEIRNNWTGYPIGFAAPIASVMSQGYEAWSIKVGLEYGVAIPLGNNAIELSEKFATARLYTDELPLTDGKSEHVLMLMAATEQSSIPFSTLCAELINPGVDGRFRQEIVNNPVMWWSEWKELLGNKNVDERIYDVLGELYTLYYLTTHNVEAVWNGPTGATYDIDCGGVYYEVKSTTARNKREIVISNPFQLLPPVGSKLYLAFCQFERAENGYCINGVVDELVQLGYSRPDLEMKLSLLGLEVGKIARCRTYSLHAMTRYEVNEDFPRITDESFLNGVRPKGIKTYSYTVNLDDVVGINLLDWQGALL